MANTVNPTNGTVAEEWAAGVVAIQVKYGTWAYNLEDLVKHMQRRKAEQKRHDGPFSATEQARRLAVEFGNEHTAPNLQHAILATWRLYQTVTAKAFRYGHPVPAREKHP